MLHGPELEIERYVNLHLTRAQNGEVANYRPGDVAVFHHDVYGVSAKAGDACRVLETQDDGRVLLAHPDGREPTIADAVLDRIVHNAYRIELGGESQRKRNKPPPLDGGGDNRAPA